MPTCRQARPPLRERPVDQPHLCAEPVPAQAGKHASRRQRHASKGHRSSPAGLHPGPVHDPVPHVGEEMPRPELQGLLKPTETYLLTC